MFKRKKKEEETKVNKYANPNRQIAFFGFYLVFFIVVIILLRTSYKNESKTTTSNSLNGYGYDYKLVGLTNNNYHFIFKETLNDKETIYEGDTLNDVISFTKSGDVALNYYISGDKAYIKDNNLLTWSETTNPIMFKDFYSSKNIQSIISVADYIYKTEYMDESVLNFGYTISNNKIRKILNLEEKEEDQDKNAIIVFTDKSGNVKSIYFELTNYYKNIDPSINKYILSFNYSKFNEIKEITNPLN